MLIPCNRCASSTYEKQRFGNDIQKKKMHQDRYGGCPLYYALTRSNRWTPYDDAAKIKMRRKFVCMSVSLAVDLKMVFLGEEAKSATCKV